MAFNVLAKETEVKGRCLLEASAGTGKTFAIEHIATRLLLEDEEISLSQILLVTFTRASTRELKMRFHKNLEDVLRFLKEGKNEFPYLENITNFDKAIEKIESALRTFDEAGIYTIHAFCHRNLMENAFECGENLLLNSPDEKCSTEKLNNFIRDFLHSLEKEKYHHLELKEILLKYRNPIKLLLRKAPEETQEKRYTDLFSDCTKALQALEKVEEDKLVEDFHQIAPFFKKIQKKHVSFDKQLKLICELMTKRTLESFIACLDARLNLFQFLSPKNRKVNQNGAEKIVLHYPGFFEKASSSLAPIFESFFNHKRIQKLLLNDLKKPLEEFLEKEEHVEPDAILEKMQKSLQRESFKKRVRSKYRAVIIDEFQDTDPIQWEIFRNLFLDQNPIETLYLVGDPKQSIYGFRSADIYTYLDAAKAIGKTLYLDTNYRSNAPLISALNSFFSLKPGWLFLPKRNEVMEFQAVKASRSDKRSENPVQFLVLEKKHVRGSWPSASIESDYFLPAIFNEIIRVQEPFSDWAILVRDRFQANRVKAYLVKRNIPATCRNRSKLSDSPLFESLKWVFDAVLNPHREEKVKAALMTPFMGFNDLEIQSMAESFPDGILEKFFLLQNKLKRDGLPAFFRAFLRLTWKSSKSVLANLVSQDLYVEARELIENLLEYLRGRCFSFEKIFYFFDEIKKEEEEKEAFTLEEGVQILTIHSSKGLEFPNVVALGLINRVPEEEMSSESDAEKFRQLYVALTRPKTRLYIPILIDSSRKKPLPGSASPMELFCSHLFSDKNLYEGLQEVTKEKLNSLLGSVEDSDLISLENPIEESLYLDEKKKLQLIAPPHFKISSEKRTILSFTSLHQSNVPKVIQEPRKEILPVGAETGVIIHRILERLMMEPLREERRGAIVQSEMSCSHLKDHEKEIDKMVNLALTTPLFSNDSEFKLSDIPFDQCQVEMEFYFSKKKQQFKGFIDLFFEYKGKYFILDWKTNALSSYEKDSLDREANSKGYYLQSAIYTQAIKNFLEANSNTPFESLFGGAFIVFLRGLKEGQGILSFESNLQLLEHI